MVSVRCTPTCTHGFAWGNQYSVAGRKRNELSSLQLIVPNARDAADGTGDFLLSAGFGDLMRQGYVEYRINTPVQRIEAGRKRNGVRGRSVLSGKVAFQE